MNGACKCINEDENIIYNVLAIEECDDVNSTDIICGNLNVNLFSENITEANLDSLLLCAFGGAANKLSLVADKINNGV